MRTMTGDHIYSCRVADSDATEGRPRAKAVANMTKKGSAHYEI